jgi:glycerophosphoryl diester phosphodiesterase
MAAFRQAADRGADMLEADVRLTRDGRLVLLHDADVDRTTNGRGPAAALTLDELRRLDAGGWFSPAFADERVPELAELYELAEQEGVALCLEVKAESPAGYAALARELAGEIALRGRLDVDVLASFDHEALAEAARTVPGLRCAPDRLPERGASDGRALVAQASAIGASILQHHHEDLTAAAVADVQGAGIDVWAWPVNTHEEIERVLDFGVAGVMGDDVAALVGCVGDRA